MKAIRALLCFSTVLFAWGIAATAQATDTIALSFELEPVHPSPPEASPETPPTGETGAGDAAIAALPIPAAATQPPLANPSEVSLPAGIYGGGQALALGEGTFPEDVEQQLPAPPPLPPGVLATALPQPQTLNAGTVKGTPAPSPAEPAAIALPPEAIDSILTFEPPPTPVAVAAHPAANPGSTPLQTSGADAILPRLFDGGPDSLVARAVGSAEGTRTPEGHRTPAYFGHVDPGNGVWNLGSFSYQHGARSPEEADTRQLQRLQQQTQILQRRAAALNLQLSAEELMNGIDLANQAPAAALDRESYLDWLQRARTLGMEGQEAIVWARTRAFLDPDTQQWNAPGLGNNIHTITRDQERRAQAIAAALTVAAPLPEAPAPSEATPSARADVPSPLPSTPEAVDTALLQEQFRLPAPSASSPPTSPTVEAAEPVGAAVPPATAAIATDLAALLEPSDSLSPASGLSPAPRTVAPTVPPSPAAAAPVNPNPGATVGGDRDPKRPDSAPTATRVVPAPVETPPARSAIGAQPQTQVWQPEGVVVEAPGVDRIDSGLLDNGFLDNGPVAPSPAPNAAQMPRG